MVVDADALIALSLEKDFHHNKAVTINYKLIQQGATIIIPSTVFPEAITTLKRAFNQPEKAYVLNKQYLEGIFQVEYINEDIMTKAAEIFEKLAISKQNTLFDAIVAATAKELGAETVFSFDNWYTKLGLKLAR